METIVQVLMLLVCFNFALKQTFGKWQSVAVTTVICALFVGGMWPWAVEQSRNQLREWLADPALMLDLAVVLTVEVVLQLGFCLLAARVQSGGRLRRSTAWLYAVLRRFPGVLIFAVLFTLLVAAIFALPGASFARVAWGTAALVAATLPTGTLLLKKLLPEEEVRLELLFLGQVLTALLGIIATVHGRTHVAGIDAVDWSALGGLGGALAAGVLLGWALYHRKMHKTNK